MSRVRSVERTRFRGLLQLAIREVGDQALRRPHLLLMKSLTSGCEARFSSGEVVNQDWSQIHPSTILESSFVAWLVKSHKAHEHFCAQKVAIFGAFLSGMLDLSSVSSAVGVSLVSCRITCCSDFSKCNLSEVNLSGSRINGLKINGGKLGGLDLSGGVQSIGELYLIGLEVATSINFSQSNFCAAPNNDKVISADGVRVGRDIFFRGTTVANGEVRLVGANVSGSVSCDGARFENERGVALAITSATISGSLHLESGFVAIGAVVLNGCSIERYLRLMFARFENPKEVKGPADRAYCLQAQVARIEGALTIQKCVFKGPVDFSSISIGTLLDEEESWPEEIELGNIKINEVSFRAPCNMRSRLRLLARVPMEEAFDAQPYIEFAKTLSSQGMEADALRLMERYWWRRIGLNIRGRVKRISRWILDPSGKCSHDCQTHPYDRFTVVVSMILGVLFVGNGYARWRCLMWMMLLIMFGTLSFGHEGLGAISRYDSSNIPCEADHVEHDSAVGAKEKFLARPCITIQGASNGNVSLNVNHFNAFLFSVDSVLPVVDLRYAKKWVPVNNTARMIVLPVLIGGGWLLVSLFAISFTGVMRKI